MKGQQTSTLDTPADTPADSGAGEGVPEASVGGCVSVVLPYPFVTAYSYLCPEDLPLVPGDFVLVPLGRREVAGVVWSRESTPEVAAEKLKPVIARFDVPPLTESQRSFLEWVAAYTVTPLGSVLKLTLGSGQALEPPTPRKALRLAAGWEETDGAADGLRMTPARRKVLALAADGLARSARDLAREAGVGLSLIHI